MENEKNRGLLVWIIILCLVIIGLFAYTIYDTKLKDKNSNNEPQINDKDNDHENNDNMTLTELNLNDSLVTRLYNYIGSSDKDGVIYEYFHSNKKLNSTNVNNHIKLRTALLYSSDIDLKNNKQVSGDKVITAIKKIYGSGNGYKHVELLEGGSLYPKISCDKVEYDSTKDIYIRSSAEGCGEIKTTSFHGKLVKAIKSKDTIVLTEKTFISEYDGVYNNSIDRIKLDSEYKTNKEDEYFEKGSTVTYTFRIGENNNYYFESSNIK